MSEKGFTLPSYAKINWLLRVLGKREDGFHELCTVFQTVGLCDQISFAEGDQFTLTTNNSKIPSDERNLIVKAARLLAERLDVREGARIHLEKIIPAPGGLGGGSSNAAVALLGLLRLWNRKIDFRELVEIGAEIGSDVPFFFYGGTAFGTGRGTEITPIKDLEENYLLLVTPEKDVSTREAFARLGASRLTKEASKSILQICATQAENLDLRLSDLKNDFERSVFQAEPEIGRVKDTLLELGARSALLSGSGASVFAIFDKEETRQTAQKAILVEEENWRSFAVATVSRAQYRREALEKVFEFASDQFL